MEFAIIGGTSRGYKLIETLIEKSFIPKFAVVLKEDKHEIGKNLIALTFLYGARIIKHYLHVYNKNSYFEQLL